MALAPNSTAPVMGAPSADGRFGRFGGRFVPETLVPACQQLEAAFTEGYGALDRAVLDGLIRLHGASTLAWAERHGDEAFRQLGRRILGL